MDPLEFLTSLGGVARGRKDMSRSNIAQTQAYAVLSYAPEQIWNSPDMVLKEIRAVLKRGRPRG
jgi:very-short-patch-repair endonuclease